MSEAPVRVGVDASNLRQGGGVTHLRELLAAVQPEEHGVGAVTVWGDPVTLGHLPDRPFLTKIAPPGLGGSGLARQLWRMRELPRLADTACDILFVPGGALHVGFRPYVTMSQNMLPFDLREARRYGPSRMLARLLLLRLGQARTFRQAEGMIFLTECARRVVGSASGGRAATAVIPHGVNEAFRQAPRPQRLLSDCSPERPLRILYVSIVDVYKHQWRAAEAAVALGRRGLPIRLELVGPAYPPALKRLRETLDRLDPAGRFARYDGPVPYADLPARYHEADVFLFASSCENMPNILLEAMAAGLPIACAERGPMPDMLGQAGLYFDPERADSIAQALERLVRDHDLRARLAAQAFEQAQAYDWRRCARDTFSFIASVARGRA